MSKFYRLQYSTVARAGKLATGSAVKADRDTGLVTGAIAPIEVLLITSPRGGASTRKINLAGDLFPAEAIGAIEAPTLFLTMGGVGSTESRPFGLPEGEAGPDLTPIRFWNWSGRTGGHTVIDPIAVVAGRGIEPPPAKSGFMWIQTYWGATLSEFILVQLDEGGAIHPRHILPDVSLERLSPPERFSDLLDQLGSEADRTITREGAGPKWAWYWEISGKAEVTLGELVELYHSSSENRSPDYKEWLEELGRQPQSAMAVGTTVGRPAVKRVRRIGTPPPLAPAGDEFVEVRED